MNSSLYKIDKTLYVDIAKEDIIRWAKLGDGAFPVSLRLGKIDDIIKEMKNER